MAGRAFPWSIIALLFALAAPAAAPAVDILRLNPKTDGISPVTLAAEEVFTWVEGTEQVFVLGGSVWIQQDHTEVIAPRAVVWVDAEAVKRRQPAKVTVYAIERDGKNVRVKTRGRAEEQVEGVILEFTSPAWGQVRGKTYEWSVADSGLYQRAKAARGPVAPAASTGQATVGADPVERALALQPDPSAPVAPGVADPQFVPKISGPTVLPVPVTESRRFWLAPRTNRGFNVIPVTKGANGENTYVITGGGVKLAARFQTGSLQSMEMEADQVVIWQHGGDAKGSIDAMTTAEGSPGHGIEIFLCGNVVVRMQVKQDLDTIGRAQQWRVIRADRVFYDTNNHRAIAHGADMEFTRQGFANTAHIASPEILQISSTEFTAFEAVLSASRLPSDPGFGIRMRQVDVYQQPETVKTTIFGRPFRKRESGEAIEEKPQILEATDMNTELVGVPITYWPFARVDVNDPFGPFAGASIGQGGQFGTQIYTNWDVFKLIGLTPYKNERWQLLVDYLSRRGPALGTNYSILSDTFMGMDAPFQTQVKGYMIDDGGTDILGGNRQNEYQPTHLRGRFLFRHQQEFEDLTVQAQVAYLSDQNFLEQYYKFEHDSGPNQETFLWLRYQQGNAVGTLLVEPPLGRQWVNEANWMPRADGYLIGQSLFERLTYSTWGSAGYADLRTWRPPLNQNPTLSQYPTALQFPNSYLFPPAERGVSTGRFDWMQQLSAPFDVGPVRVVPYGNLDLAYYTEDNNGNGMGRVYGGAGVRASVPLSRLYPDVGSELFNLNGLYHKNLFSANYYIAGSTASLLNTPQLNRLNDDAMQQAYEDIIPWEPTFPQLQQNGKGWALTAGSYTQFNPRYYALRRLIDWNPDNLDNIQELQLDWRQRWQTKRGYQGLEHTVDWLTVDLSASVFPAKDRDNFGSAVGFIEANAVWNVGDRNGYYLNAWVDPFNFGTRYWELGSFFYRDDRTSLSLSYKYLDPVQSRLVSLSTNYVFSPKYAMTFITGYDFGYKSSLTNTLLFTRVGTDMSITAGFTYNSVIKTFSFVVDVLPNLMTNQASPVPYKYGGYGSGGSNSGFTNSGGSGQGTGGSFGR